jgi:ribosomal protein L34E
MRQLSTSPFDRALQLIGADECRPDFYQCHECESPLDQSERLRSRHFAKAGRVVRAVSLAPAS